MCCLRHQVNGIDITVAPHDQAVVLLTGIRGEISLVISRDSSDIRSPTSTMTSSNRASVRDVTTSGAAASDDTQSEISVPFAFSDAINETVHDQQELTCVEGPEVERQAVITEITPSITNVAATESGSKAEAALLQTSECDVISSQQNLATLETSSVVENSVVNNKPNAQISPISGGANQLHSHTSRDDTISKNSEPEMMATAVGSPTTHKTTYDETLRTYRELLASDNNSNEDKRPVTSFKMSDEEFKMHAALMAAGCEFGLSPPGGSEVSATATGVHLMIQDEMLQTMTLL